MFRSKHNNSNSRTNNNTMSRRNEFPQPYKSQPEHVRKFRFQSTQGNNFTITRECLLNLIGFVAPNPLTTTVQAFTSIIGGIKLDRVQVWSSTYDVANPFTTVSVLWNGANSPNKEVSDTGNSQRPAHVTSSPPKDTLAQFWSLQTNTTQNEVLFTLRVNDSDIIDINVTYVLLDGPTTQTFAVATPATPTSGLYYAALDNRSTTGTLGTQALQPVSLTQVIMS